MIKRGEWQELRSQKVVFQQGRSFLCRRAEDTLERMRWEKKKRDYKIKREEINANDAIAWKTCTVVKLFAQA